MRKREVRSCDPFCSSAGFPSAAGKSVINAGEVLTTNEFLVADNRAFYAPMQSDGNFCVYHGSGPSNHGPAVWCSNVVAPGGVFYATMQTDGNFCVYPGRPGGTAPSLWCTKTSSAGGPAYAVMNGDANFIVYSGIPPAYTGILFQHGVTFSYVSLSPASGGSIQWPDGSTCGTVCAKIVRNGTVQLNALAGPGFSFTQWTGGRCANATANPCVLNLTGYVPGAIGATFAPQ